jgi:hypothetical protein
MIFLGLGFIVIALLGIVKLLLSYTKLLPEIKRLQDFIFDSIEFLIYLAILFTGIYFTTLK